MLSSVIRRFFSSNTDAKLIAGYFKTKSLGIYSESLNGAKVDAKHPVIIKSYSDGKSSILMQATSTPYVIRQSADETVSKQETILLDENNNIVGDPKAQYAVLPTQEVPVDLKDVKIIAGSDKFIERNRDKILSISNDKNNVVSDDDK